jgi:hypothetical protein
MEVDDEEVAGEEDEGPEAREEAVSGLLYQISMLAMDDGVQGGLITSRRGAGMWDFFFPAFSTFLQEFRFWVIRTPDARARHVGLI